MSLDPRGERGRILHRYFQIKDEIFLCTPLKVEEPTSFQEVADSLNQREWMHAMEDEMDSTARYKGRKLVDIPP